MTCCINYDYEIFERFIGSLFDCTDNKEYKSSENWINDNVKNILNY